MFKTILTCLFLLGTSPFDALARGDEKKAEFEETVVAGGPSDFMEVRHIKLRGSNFEIGKKLAQIAYSRHKTGPIPYPDRGATRAQVSYFEEHYPVHIERMRGVAAAFGKDLDFDAWNFTGLLYGIPLGGCSVVFYPPETTKSGEGVMSRNFDFTTGTFDGRAPKDGELPACARPYIIEMYPDEGYATLVTCCFDLLSGVCDGINSEGLTVAVLSDNDVVEEVGFHPVRGFREGFNEVQIVRHLLDTCADAEEAKAALRRARLYYSMAPNHYIIADRHGHAFIWENAPAMDEGHVIEMKDGPLATTNFLHHRHPDPEKHPEEKDPLGWFNRHRTIRERIDGHEGKFAVPFMMETSRCVSLTYPMPEKIQATGRTLWHALYYPERLKVVIDFYLGEGDEKIRRSGYRTFELKP